MRRLLIAALFLLIVPGIVGHVGAHTQSSGQSTDHHVNTVILASTANYPDALVSASAARKIGVPVLLTERNEFPQHTARTLNRLAPEEVVVVGGENVISRDIITRLNVDGYAANRVWGVTRYGTSVEVAEQFWPEGAEEAVIVQNSISEERGQLLAAAKELARDTNAPIYLTPADRVPAIVQSSLQDLGVQQVAIVGPNSSDRYQAAITDLDIEIAETITGKTKAAVRKRVEERVTGQINSSSKLLVIASDDDDHALAAANLPNTYTVYVSDETSIQDAVETINEHTVTTVKVVGDRDLARQTAETLKNNTDASVTVLVSRAIEANANLTGEELTQFSKQNQKRSKQWEQRREQQREHLKKRANKTLNKADALVTVNASQKAREAVHTAQSLYEGGMYIESIESSREAINAVREDQFMNQRHNWSIVQNAMAEETGSLTDRIRDLQRLNHEFAEEMQKDMTTEERLAVIEEFRHERRETVQALMEEAQQRNQSETLLNRLRNARKERNEGRKQDSAISCSTDPQTQFTISRHDGEVHVQGTVRLSSLRYETIEQITITNESNQITAVFSFEKQSTRSDSACIAAAEVEEDITVSPGNWTTTVIVNIDGKQLFSNSTTVSVGDINTTTGNETAIDEDLPDKSAYEHTVTYSQNGFQPHTITVERGETVAWYAEGAEMQVASNIHPYHTAYGTDNTGTPIFEQETPGDFFRFVFEKEGVWKYHNHQHAEHGGIVNVTAPSKQETETDTANKTEEDKPVENNTETNKTVNETTDKETSPVMTLKNLSKDAKTIGATIHLSQQLYEKNGHIPDHEMAKYLAKALEEAGYNYIISYNYTPKTPPDQSTQCNAAFKWWSDQISEGRKYGEYEVVLDQDQFRKDSNLLLLDRNSGGCAFTYNRIAVKGAAGIDEVREWQETGHNSDDYIRLLHGGLHEVAHNFGLGPDKAGGLTWNENGEFHRTPMAFQGRENICGQMMEAKDVDFNGKIVHTLYSDCSAKNFHIK